MNIEQKKKLLADVRRALHGLGMILDGGHDFKRLNFPPQYFETLHDSCLCAMAGLSMLDAQIVAELTDAG